MEKEKPGVKIAKLVRRKHPRFLLNLPLEYSRLDSNIRRPGHAENGSEGGLMVYLPEQFRVGENLRMKLFFSLRSELQTIESTIQVVWAGLSFQRGGEQVRSKIFGNPLTGQAKMERVFK